MSKTTVNGTYQIVAALQQHGQDMEREVADELADLAGFAANRMRRLAPKGPVNTLTNSIRQKSIDKLTWEIGPNVNYAGHMEHGVKPGGKGLPRFMGAGSASIVDWLRKTPPKNGRTYTRPVRKGSKVFDAATRDLRDRYHGLINKIRAEGVEAQPFVGPTAREMEPEVLSRLNLAVRRVLAARPDAGGAA